ncbi:TnsA endonuclease N-terminal domain-containing protein [Lichenihabitans sp. Uapishka_5]|uniref:TnsA endonuclease N-terminal domain-containing protein n=1 Tax=Lichenihabitans sp. Uapishka_5 TaxID=3037302 RepID=UPI0029E81910|nr:TnsA endonuclease N-terminal domain-containing protein [Lichenihabitans sp. Uapishka_5]MDX7952926.1 TnsA endonuclease N-terminal domain-containing protein [Lichenihabitans sp. Uapishka_5]
MYGEFPTNDDDKPDTEGWRPPAASLSTRRISLRSKGSARPSIVCPKDRVIHCESDLERRVALCLLAHSSVVDLVEQPAPVAYTDHDGRTRTHTFDFIATLRDGNRLAVVVKPSTKVATQGTHRLLESLAKQVPASVATRFQVMTEKHVPADRLHDATLINSARLNSDPALDEKLRVIAAGIDGAVTIERLVEASGLGADAYRAVVRLIADGTLGRRERGRISQNTLVELAAQKASEGSR